MLQALSKRLSCLRLYQFSRRGQSAAVPFVNRETRKPVNRDLAPWFTGFLVFRATDSLCVQNFLTNTPLHCLSEQLFEGNTQQMDTNIDTIGPIAVPILAENLAIY